ncbi:glycoside hydrolase family 13 protein [Tessaracoccus lapidicaptus]|uniref:glycoside hydrolase family 13 protein n=1 Tax=Tessaracoccus lapidicaptus TaxID=1427523 RepID=UPI00333F8A1C
MPGPSTAPRDPDWWKSAVVYQIYPRSFQDSDGDGIGDLRGIIERLGHLGELGVDVVWLSPIYPSPQADNGYDISDYEDVDPMFGSLADLHELIEGLHARGMKLVMDLVVNHTSDEHPWFRESRSSRDNPKRDWYWWRDPRPGHEPGTPGAEPSNWEASFSGPAWTFDEATGQYYLHLFSPAQPDLNWENPEVRAAVHAMMERWIERGVDGFRMDVINMISKDVAADGSLPDVPVSGGSALGDPSPHTVNGPRIHEFLHEMHERVLAGRRLLTVAEAPGATVTDARLYTDPARREVDMVFTFEHVNLDIAPGGSKWDLAPLRLTDLKANLSAWQEGLAEAGWNSLYWNNHDQPRIVSRWGSEGRHRVESAKSLATVLHLMRGTPYVYQGEEVGMTNAHFTEVGQYRDIESVNWAAEALERGVPEEMVVRSLAVKSRDNARTPFHWDASPQAGFTTGTPWLAVNPNHDTINAEAARRDPGSVFHDYRRLIELRHGLDVVVHGDYRLLLPDDEQVFAYVRAADGARLLVVANLSDEEAVVDLGPDGALLDGDLLLTTHPDAERGSGPEVRLAPWESRVHLTDAG